MFDIDRWNEIWSTLSKNKMRSLLTAFGVFWGIFMLIVMAGAGNGMKNGIYEGVAAFASNSAFLWTERTSEPYKGFKRGRYWEMDSEDVKYLRANLPEIDLLTPRNFASSRGTSNIVRGLKSETYNVKGDYPDYLKIDPATLIFGRWLNDIDIRDKRKVCVIGEKVYETMFDNDEEPVGEYLKISGVYYQIIGVLRPETRVYVNGRTEESVFIPFTTMQQAYNMGNSVHLLAFTAHKGVKISDLEEKIKLLIKSRHAISPTDVQAISGINIEQQFQQINGLFVGINILTWIVGIGTLLAGVIGVSNIMLVIVRERTKEIGIQRAIGARPRTIISQIMLESVTLTTLAGYLGLVAGIALLELTNKAMQMRPQGDNVFFQNPSVDIKIALAALTVLVLAGLFAGSIPAKRALSIKPIEALREE
ncbi:MAG: ABC transporter permease [Prolixibacteraceae bacterium]|nr:ABC transporter permease [Prolixibacteraceae bacterium]